VANPYTRQLLRSNRGFDPSSAEIEALDVDAAVQA
jgi:hypothetical protein